MRARDRGVGLVFQNYALFRHMTVADNIEFALRVRRMKAADRRARRKELLKLVALEGMDERLPGQLSGGQQQRVAVARALAHKPQVLLLDEPFGALDAKIREELRRTIRSVQRELGITTVLVTHDQEEAFALADTIGVMNHGRLLEVGNPNDLYAQPATRFVATFLGAANLLLARQSADGIRFGATPVNAEGAEPRAGGPRARSGRGAAARRSRDRRGRARSLTSNYIARGAVEEIVFTGALERLRVRLLDEPCAAQLLGPSGNGDARLEITRTQPERRASAARARARRSRSARGGCTCCPRRCRVSSPARATEAEAAALAREPLLESLSTRMKTRVGLRAIDGLTRRRRRRSPASPPSPVAPAPPTPWNGCCAMAPPKCWCCRAMRRARRGSSFTGPMKRRARATLAVAASLLRHVSAEAVYLGIVPEGRAGQRARRRRCARCSTRVPKRSRVTASRCARNSPSAKPSPSSRATCRPGTAQMLVLGITDITQAGSAYRSLLAAQPGWPVLIVYRPPESRAAPELVASGTAA